MKSEDRKMFFVGLLVLFVAFFIDGILFPMVGTALVMNMDSVENAITITQCLRGFAWGLAFRSEIVHLGNRVLGGKDD